VRSLVRRLAAKSPVSGEEHDESDRVFNTALPGGARDWSAATSVRGTGVLDVFCSAILNLGSQT
jgi:hypothetical protein